MKKVIKPSKQPTKKQSQRRQRNTNTAKLKKAIGKIAAQLVKDHPKLVKGGGSSGITDLIFSKNLMKGGEINDELREDIVKFLKDSAPKVNKLKKELIIKIIEYFINDEKAVTDDSLSIVNINEDFNKGVYGYKDNYKEPFKEHLIDKQDIYDDFIILEIVKKFYILSRIKDDIPKEISNVKFEKLPDDIISALNNYKHDGEEENREGVKTKIKGLLDKYKDGKGEDAAKEGNTPKKIDNEAKYAELVANAEEVYEKNRDIVKKIQKSKDIELSGDKIIAKEGIELDEEKKNRLNEFNELYTELKDKEKIIKAEMDKFNGNTPPDDKIVAVQILIDGFNNSYKKIFPFYQIFGTTINVPDLQDDDDDTRRETGTELVLFEKKEDKTPGGGKPAPKYKSTGQVVNIMYKKRKYKRTIFVKEKRKTKYCKINNEYILLSKLNVL